jgi:hypothetical protein
MSAVRDNPDDFLVSTEGVTIMRRAVATVHANLRARTLRDSARVMVRCVSGEGYLVRADELRRFYRVGAGR